MADLSQIPTDQLVQMLAAHPAVQAAPAGPQPSLMDKVIASPAGRFVQSNIVDPVAGVIHSNPIAGNADAPGNAFVSPVQHFLDQASKSEQAGYQAALARNRNTPGYAAARTAATTNMQPSGLSDQMLPTLSPVVAGLPGMLTGNMDTSNAMADQQTDGQAAFGAQHPTLSKAANIAGGLLMGPERGALPQIAAAQSVPTVADLKAASRLGYQAVDNSGVRLSPDAMNGMADSFDDKFGGRVDPILYPKATAAYNRVLQYGTDGAKGAAPATFTDLDNLRRVVGAAAKSPDSADAGLAGQMIDHLDNFTDRLTPDHLDTSLQDELRANLVSTTGAKGKIAKQIKTIEQTKPGALAARGAAGAGTRASYVDMVQNQLPAAEQARLQALGDFKSESDLINGGPQDTIDALNNARGLWARAKQTETIQGVIDDAQINAQKGGASLDQTLRNGFASLAKNDKQMARLSPDVQQSVLAVVKGSPTANALKLAGKLAIRGPVSAAFSLGAGVTAASMPGAIALPLVGEAARFGAARMTAGAAQRASDVAALGRTAAPALPAPALQLPRLTPQSVLPFGIAPQLPRLQRQ